MTVSRRIVWLIGAFAFLIPTTVYLLTMQRSVPFWDSGEFIAVSFILGIPHPPGTPFYVLLGRIATLLPFGSIAERVNGMSAVASGLAVMVTFLTTLRLIRLTQGTNRSTMDEVLALAGAFGGSMLLAFSDVFWENGTEAEVYALMSLAQVLVFWLGLRWWEAHEKRPTAGPLLVAVYLMWVSVGLHLGVGMAGLPLLVLVWLVDRRAAWVFMMPLLSVLFVTWGLERMAAGIIALSTITFIYFAWQKKLPGWLVLASLIPAGIGISVGAGDSDFTPVTGLIAAVSIVVPLTVLALRTREGKIIALALVLMVIGYSTHIYLPIRAAQHPAINEGDPSSWQSLRDLLERKQYGSTSMFVRRAPVEAQLNKEFWRYFRRQWPLFPTEKLWAVMLPLILGLGGAWWHFRRERLSFLTTATMFLFATVGMILFLNFTDHEVRDRDYFYTTGFHWFAIWIGVGMVWLVKWVRESFPAGMTQRIATLTALALVLTSPVLLANNLWFTHDRSHNEIARDYAYNMLQPLAKNAFIYTNGDNDTFPLWYLQQVEGIRKDVRVVNLSLLNTDWYIFQLRDQEPKVPVELDDNTIRMLGQGAVQDQQGNLILTSQYMVQHIMQVNRDGNGWKKPPYFAVTVPQPEQLGFDKQLTLEGLVYRVSRDTVTLDIDEEATRRNMYDVFKYKGLFTADGSWDPTVYKDENASTLSRNYAAAHLQLAMHYRDTGRLPEAITEMERVERMFPDFVGAFIPLGKMYMEDGDTAKAHQLYTRLVKSHPDNPDAQFHVGVTSMYRNDPVNAMQHFDRAIALDPEYFYAYIAAYSLLMEQGRREQALAYLQRWLDRHPEDQQVRATLDAHRRELGITPRGLTPAPLPPPGAR